MRPAPSTRARGHLGRGALFSLLLHAQLILPLVIAAVIYGGREEARRAEEVDVAFEDVKAEDLPQDLPSVDTPPTTPESPDRLQPEASRPPPPEPEKKKKRRPDEAQQPAPAKPEPEIAMPPPPQPAEAEPPPPKPERHEHEKAVALDDDKPDDTPAPDAKYLAEKNRRVAEETRAKETNLERESHGDKAASKASENKDDDPGGERERTAQLAERKSAAGKQAPALTPHEKAELASDEQRRSHSLLDLRDPAPRAHELTPETADPSLPHAADGDVSEHTPPRGADARADRARGQRLKLALSGRDYEYLFGEDAEADRRLSQQLVSTHAGRFQKRQARVRSALENFIPEVKPGNQTALNTRAAPFAAYVARMHRSIHMLWGFGALEDWDEMGSSNPLNNLNLETTLEMVLNGDGTVDKVTIVRGSGYLPYDAAAIDVAYTAGPYPDPPRAIRSANGKIYLHWHFYRDARQCATSGVDPFILDNPPAGSDRPSLASLEGAPRPVAPRAPTETPGEGPRHLRRDLDDDAHRAKMRSLDSEVERASLHESHEEPVPREPRAPAGSVAEAGEPAARAVATRWFAALTEGDVGTLASVAELPFHTAGGADVRARAELVAMLKDLSGEVGRHGAGPVRVYTAAGLRAAVGRMPPGLDDTAGQLFAVTALRDGDTLIAALARRGEGFRVVALARR